MELNILFEQEAKHVSGVTEATTCHDLIMAIAQSVGMTGCYSLSMRLPTPYGGAEEKLLAPQDKPVQMLTKLQLNPSSITFVLRRRATDSVAPTSYDSDSGTRQGNPQSLSNPSSSRSPEEDMRQKWRDQLSYQEQEIEYNRMQIVQLEKDLAHLEQQCRLADPPKLQQAVQEQREELVMLQRMDFPRLLAEEKRRGADIQAQWNKVQEESVEIDLSAKQCKEKITVLEQKVSAALEQCLAALRDSNIRLQDEVHRLESSLAGGNPAAMQTAPGSRVPQATSAQGGANSYWV